MDNIGCSGYESKLVECNHLGWGRHNCGHGEDVGVRCGKYVSNAKVGIFIYVLQIIISYVVFQH